MSTTQHVDVGRTIQDLEDSELSKENTAAIREFINHCAAEGLSESRQVRHAQSLKPLLKKLAPNGFDPGGPSESNLKQVWLDCRDICMFGFDLQIWRLTYVWFTIRYPLLWTKLRGAYWIQLSWTNLTRPAKLSEKCCGKNFPATKQVAEKPEPSDISYRKNWTRGRKPSMNSRNQ